MMKKLKFLAVATAYLSVVMVLNGCEGGSGNSGDGSDTPTASAAPASPASIAGDTSIVINFSTSMDTTTLILGGTLAAESDGGTWSTVTVADDTLTIAPSAQWSDGAKTLTVDVSDLNGTAIGTLNLSYTVDATLPVASVNPTDTSTILASDTIVITYTESMDTASLGGAGTLWSESDNGVWSTTTNTDDTLTLSPASSWTSGAGTLDITADDLVGNTSVVNLSYNVDADGDGYVVPADCDDTAATINPGATEVCGDGIDNDCDAIIDNPGICTSCSVNSTCNDGNECTDDICSAAVCTNPLFADGTACTGGTCQSGVCVVP
jgi:hypothetical protein